MTCCLFQINNKPVLLSFHCCRANNYNILSGKLEIHEDNVERMVATANMLRLEDVVDAGCSFLMKQLHPSNCLGIRAFADIQSCHKLLKAAHDYTMVCFSCCFVTWKFYEYIVVICALCRVDNNVICLRAFLYEYIYIYFVAHMFHVGCSEPIWL